MPETHAGPVTKKEKTNQPGACFTASFIDGRTQAEDTGSGHSPNKGQNNPERPAGNKLRTQAEDTAQTRARATQRGTQDAS